MSAASLPAGAREPSAIELIEEAVHLLRRASPGTLALYYLGAVPWVLALLFFWAHTTWFAPTPATVAWAALGLAALFVWLKVAQVEFCARLWAQRLGQLPPRLGLRREWQVAEQQLRLQPWGLPVLLLAAVVSLPFGWLYAFYQNAVVLGGISRERNIGLRDEAWAQAMAWPKQNHVGLLCLSLLALAILGNVATAFWVVPWLANRLLGIDNLFGTRGWWMVNTTFLASVVMLAWLAVDPLMKAFYVLRVFHGRARSTARICSRNLRRRKSGDVWPSRFWRWPYAGRRHRGSRPHQSRRRPLRSGSIPRSSIAPSIRCSRNETLSGGCARCLRRRRRRKKQPGRSRGFSARA